MSKTIIALLLAGIALIVIGLRIRINRYHENIDERERSYVTENSNVLDLE